MNKLLVVLVGATGVGKTEMSIGVAKHLGAQIVSADSRQVYREMKIGTAFPTAAELAAVPHHLVGFVPLEEHYNAGMYEREALSVLDTLFAVDDTVLMVGGSGLYVDAVCNGMDKMPDADFAMRAAIMKQWESEEGRAGLLKELKLRDPGMWDKIDRNNPVRVCRAVEVCRQTGRPYSAMRSGEKAERPFRVVKIGLQRDREELYSRINARVDEMVREGLAEEARELYPRRELKALQTVGYSELFDHFDGKTTLEEATELIKRNTRRYAKRQTTWFGADAEINWFHPDDMAGVKKFLEEIGR